MDIDIPEQLRKVQKFSRYGRMLCLYFYVVAAGAALVLLYGVLFGGSAGMKMNFGPYQIAANQALTAGEKVWAIIAGGCVFALVFSALFHLHRLFAGFIVGRVYTRESVRHIRQLGMLSLAMAILQVLIPIFSTLLLQVGVVDRAHVILLPPPGYAVFSGVLPGFITSGVILLASWIMELGRQTRDEAEQLRRDAELVV
jgi:hypothetical protein